MGSQIGGDLIDHARRNQRLVTLHVDHDRVGFKTQFRRDFGQTIGAGIVILTGQHHFGTKSLAGLDDARIVSRDDHTAGAAFARLFPDVLDHRLAGDQQQRLARQAGGGITRWNDDGKGCGHLSRRSSVVRVRASDSSITGMPSRIG
ncbi:hypothetical protein D3C84_925750 [compost metagenome]